MWSSIAQLLGQWFSPATPLEPKVSLSSFSSFESLSERGVEEEKEGGGEGERASPWRLTNITFMNPRSEVRLPVDAHRASVLYSRSHVPFVVRKSTGGAHMAFSSPRGYLFRSEFSSAPPFSPLQADGVGGREEEKKDDNDDGWFISLVSRSPDPTTIELVWRTDPWPAGGGDGQAKWPGSLLGDHVVEADGLGRFVMDMPQVSHCIAIRALNRRPFSIVNPSDGSCLAQSDAAGVLDVLDQVFHYFDRPLAHDAVREELGYREQDEPLDLPLGLSVDSSTRTYSLVSDFPLGRFELLSINCAPV